MNRDVRTPSDAITREINRRILTRVPDHRARLAQALWWLVMVGGIALLIVAQDHGWTLAAVAGLVITLGGFFGSIRDHDIRLRAQPGLDDARADELMAGAPREFVVRRRLAYGWPLTLTLMSLPFFVIALNSGTTPAPLIIGVRRILEEATRMADPRDVLLQDPRTCVPEVKPDPRHTTAARSPAPSWTSRKPCCGASTIPAPAAASRHTRRSPLRRVKSAAPQHGRCPNPAARLDVWYGPDRIDLPA